MVPNELNKNDLKDLLDKLTDDYDQGHPSVSDKEWDDLYFQLENPDELDIHYDFVTKLEKINHNHKMLSLAKTKSIEEVSAFINKHPYIAMAKMDGLTCSLRYVNGELVSAETRGDGFIGEDVTHNAKVIPSIPNKINYQDELIVDGEIICNYKDFEKFADEYRNPRNFATGSIRLLDASECASRNLTFVVWDVIKGFDDIELLSTKLNNLNSLGFIIVPNVDSVYYDDFQDDIDYITNSSKALLYPIDGVVFKFNNIAYGKEQGETAHHFKNAIAYKFYDELYDSYLRNIEWTMGRSGVLTPVAIFDPVEIDGTIVEKASLHNVKIMKQILGTPYERQPIKVFKANMIIPQIESGQPCKNDIIPIPIPELCPICGGPVTLIQDNGFLMCDNDNCAGKIINRLDHFCSKKGLDIRGLSKNTLDKLLDWGWIEKISDIFGLSKYREDWISKPGFGEKSVDNILAAINDAKTTTLESFLSAIGIPLIGRSVVKELLKHIHSYDEFRKMVDNNFDFSEYDGFAWAKTAAINNFDYTDADKMYFEKIINIIDEQHEPATNVEQTLNGKTIVITGKLENYSNRAALQAEIEAHGGKVVGSVSKNTDLLINNDTNSTSAKNLSAQKLGVQIISEKDFCNTYLTF